MGFSRTQIGAVQFGRYRLTERLGAGGMAVVYRAVVDGPEGFTRSMVIKRVLPELARDPSFLKMLVTEARLSALLHHPGIVQVHELGDVDGEFYLAMEFVDGYDLSTVLKQARRVGRDIPTGVAAYVVSEIAGALAYAHALTDDRGRPLEIVHRDISPSNIMVTKQGSAKLLDFGIAKAASCVRDELTRTGTLKGKLSYMSPEQADGRAVDRRTDVFALGIVLHEALTMRRLFRGDDDLQTLRLVREAQVLPPSATNAAVDAELDSVVMGMLARDPALRLASCDEVVAALGPIVHRLRADAVVVRKFLEEMGPIQTKSAQLGEAGVATPTFPTGVQPAAETAVAAGRTVTRSNGELRPTTVTLPPLRPRRLSIAIAVGATLALAIGSAVFLARRGPTPAAIEPATTSLAPPAPVVAPVAQPVASVAQPRTVRLRVTGPGGATVFVDDQRVGVTPLDVPLPAHPGSRTVVVRSARGRVTETVPADQDATVSTRAAAAHPPARRHDRTEIRDPFAP